MKKNKVEKGKAESKKGRRSVEKEVNSGEEDPEETVETKETTDEEEVEMMKDVKVIGRSSRQSEDPGNQLIGKELVDFQNNFNLVTSASPGKTFASPFVFRTWW